MKKLLFFIVVLFSASCSEKPSDSGRTPLLELEGKFLYKDEIDKIRPTNTSVMDEVDIAGRYVRKWVTRTLTYENAKRSIDNPQ